MPTRVASLQVKGDSDSTAWYQLQMMLGTGRDLGPSESVSVSHFVFNQGGWDQLMTVASTSG